MQKKEAEEAAEREKDVKEEPAEELKQSEAKEDIKEDIKEQFEDAPFLIKEPETLTNDFKGKSIEELNEEMIRASRAAVGDKVVLSAIP